MILSVFSQIRTSHAVESQNEESHEDGLGGEQGDRQR